MSESKLNKKYLTLLESDSYVGRVVSMNYQTAIVASHDKNNRNVEGLPQRCFLLAIPEETSNKESHIILLRIESIEPLEKTRDMNTLREELAYTGTRTIDAETVMKLQLTGYNCDVMGEFYNVNGKLMFGADIERVYSYNRYKVVKPKGEALSIISSYSRRQSNENSSRTLQVGRVRYSETEPTVDNDAVVKVDIEDFIGKKTAFFGQSRSGKALPKYTIVRVPMSDKFPEGKARNSELSKKDKVVGVDGKEYPILSFTEWEKRETFQFLLKGGKKVSSADNHIWKIRNNDAMNYAPVARGWLNRYRDMKIKDHINKTSVMDYGSLDYLETLSGFTIDVIAKMLKLSGITECLSLYPDDVEGFYGKHCGTETDTNCRVFPIRESLQVLLDYSRSYASLYRKKYSPKYKLVTTEQIVDMFRNDCEVLLYNGSVSEVFEDLKLESVISEGVQEVRCLTVDSPDSMFMVEDNIPTHNSNSVKLIVQQVFNYSKQSGMKIGQIVFDPQGEYANPNEQDKGALSEIGEAHDVAVYSVNGGSGKKLKPLKFNFLRPENRALCWDLMLTELRNGVSGSSNYVQSLMNLDMNEPTQQGDSADAGSYIQMWTRYQRRVLGMYAFMYLAKIEGRTDGFEIPFPKEMQKLVSLRGEPSPLDVEIPVDLDGADNVRKPFYQEIENFKELFFMNDGKGGKPDRIALKTTEAAFILFERLYRAFEIDPDLMNDSWKKSFSTGEMSIFREQYEAHLAGKRGVTSSFMKIRGFHSVESSGDVRSNVWEDLKSGRLVIVDLARGDMAVTRTISEMIVTYLISSASERFINGEPNIPFQIVVEEAHNLFGRGEDNEDLLNPWVRVSKEAAKYGIGLMYSTQEITSVDPRILSNTSNWIISHLNSRSETRELSKYYGFADWEQHLIRCESKGFVRLKTESSPYIVPVQIKLFNPKEK